MGAQNNWIRFRWIMTVLCLVAAVFCLGTGPALGAGTEYYVDSLGGDDANDGLSWDTAWQTLHHAIQEINGGASGTASTPYTLYLGQGGIVDGDVFALPLIDGKEPDAPLYITQDYLTIAGEGTGAVIDGTGAAFRGWEDGLDIQSAQNIVIQNVVIQNFNANGIHMGSAVDCTVDACRIHNNGVNGIAIAYGMGQPPAQSSGNTIQNGCEIYENGEAGIYIFNGTGNRIINNIGSIYDNGTSREPGYGIVIWSDPGYESYGHNATDNLVENNTISWTGGSTYIQGTGIYSHGPGYGASPNNELIHNYIALHPENGIELYNTSAWVKRNTLVDNNVGVRIEANGSALGAGGAFWNNLIYDDAGTSDFFMIYGFTMVATNGGNINYPTLYHNTIDGGTGDGINIDITGGTSSPAPEVFANIITGFDGYGACFAGSGSVALDDMSYNNMWDNTSGPYSGCGPGANDLYLDPLYINSGGGDFHLDPDYSPCVDPIPSGVSPVCADLDHPDSTPCWRPQPIDGNWDMGCYETALGLPHTVEFIAGSDGSIIGTTIQTVAHGGGTTEVTASPFSGYEFAGWTGSYVGSITPLTITNVRANMTIYANFRRIPVVTTWVVRFEAGNGGRVDGDTVQVINNGSSTRSVEAVPNAGYAFDRWTGSYNGTANPLILNNVTSNMTITANFRRVPSVETHTVNFIAGAGGSISGSTAQVVAHGGSTSAVTAVPDPSHEFAGWSGDYTATTDSLTITNVTSNMTVHANFRRIEVTTYTVNFIANAGGRIDGNTTQAVAEGENCDPVTAVADDGFEFVGWSGDAAGTDATLTVTNVTENMTIYADFREKEPVTYTVAFSAGTGGYISGETVQIVEEGNDCAPVTAVALPGYTFAGWSGDADGTDATLMVTNVTTDMAVTALFDENVGNHPPEKPLLLSPIDDEALPPGLVTLVSGPFSDPEDDDHVGSWRQVTRFGTSDIVHDTQSGSDLTSHTIPGLAPGVKYAWRVAYQDAGSGEYTWSETGIFIVGTPAVDENIPPVDPGTLIGDYRMVSFVSWPVPSSAEAVFGPLLPEGYDPALLRIGTYDPVLGGYREYPDFSVEPGRSYWFLAREGLDLSVEGIPVSTGVDFCMGLGFNPANGDGWNMIAPPNDRHYALGDLVVSATDGAGHTVFGPMPVALLTPDNPYLDVRIWSWASGDYVASDDPGFVLEAYNGYWVRAKGVNVTLCFPADAPVAMHSFDGGDAEASLLGRFSTWMAGILPDIDTAHADASHDKPPMPMSALEDGAGGSVGCFIETIAAF